MTKPPRKKPAKAGASKVSPTLRKTPVSALAPRQSSPTKSGNGFAALVERVVAIIDVARSRVVRAVNSEMVLAYWQIGREIVDHIQSGEARAEYGQQVIEDLSAHLLTRIGRGYSTRSLWYFRDFYLTYETGHRQSGSMNSAQGLCRI